MTPNQKLAELILGRPIATWIADQRADGYSWSKISRNLYIATDGKVDVSYQTLSNWEATDTA